MEKRSPSFDALLNTAREFYDFVLQRDKVMLATLQIWLTRKELISLSLSTGGFHKDGFKEL